jgi:hypothetical protein
MGEENEIQQTDTSADSSDELQSLLAEYETQTARPAAGNGNVEQSADAPHNGGRVNGDATDTWLDEAIWDAECTERAQRSRAYYESLQLDKKIQTIQAHEYERDLNATVANVRGNLDKNVFPDKIVRAWLDAEVREDEGLKNVWLNRAQDPRMWQAAERNLIKQFRQEAAQRADPELTEDRAMVAAAIRGASAPAQTESAPNYSRLSNPEMRDEMRKLGIQPNF